MLCQWIDVIKRRETSSGRNLVPSIPNFQGNVQSRAAILLDSFRENYRYFDQLLFVGRITTKELYLEGTIRSVEKWFEIVESRFSAIGDNRDESRESAKTTTLFPLPSPAYLSPFCRVIGGFIGDVAGIE